MLPSEKIELGIFKFVTAVGRSRSVTISELSAALNPNADFEILIERLEDLNELNRIHLSKTGGGGISVLYSAYLAFEGKANFFYQGSFVIEIATQGRKYFEDIESKEGSVRVEPAKNRELREPSSKTLTNRSTINWPAIHNRLFTIIDQPKPLYYSGPDYIRQVQEVRSDFPDYYDYLKLRESESKSTTRAIYYRDILLELEERERFTLVSNILTSIEKFDPFGCAAIRKLLSSGVSAPSALIPDHAWNADRLNQYLRDMDAAVASGNYPLSVTLSYTCFEGFLGAFLRAKIPSDKYPTEIIELAILVRDYLKSTYKDCPPEVLNNIGHAAHSINRTRDGFSDSHFGGEAGPWLATYIRDLVNTQIRLLLHFM
jgi:hypothetical protein